MKITRKDTFDGGIFEVFNDKGVNIGEMTFVNDRDNIIIINHTGVRPEYEGLGIGKDLVMEGVKYAREHSLKIVPMCSFAKVIFQRYDDIKDVLK